MKSAKHWIEKLNLQPHPEGGYYKEVYRSTEKIDSVLLSGGRKGKRSISTAIYFLLDRKNFSTFHRIKSDEIWHFYDGYSLVIYVIDEKGLLKKHTLDRENPMQIILENQWFSAELKDKTTYALICCTVAPGFDFDDFEMGERIKLIEEYPQHKEVILRLTK